MKLCKKCLIPETRPGITYDNEGVCFPCRVREMHHKIDWNQRRKELEKIAQWGRTHSRCGYDCIVAVSGGKDSTRQALYARDELGLKPLLVSSTYPPEQQTDLGAYNIENLISLGFDTMIIGPKPKTWKEMMRRAFFKYGNWCVPTEMALYAIPTHIATAYKIPLIFLGENNALASGDIGGSKDGEANKIKYNNTLGGGDPKDMLGEGITARDLPFHKFPSDEDMQDANIRIVYMGYYIEDFTPYRNADIAIENGLKIRDVKREDIGALNLAEDLDEDYVHVNQLLKYYKLGFSRATDDACQAIRHGLMNRDEAIELVKRYEGKCAQRYIDAFCRYLGISHEKFWQVADSFRNEKFWKKDQSGNWQNHHTIV